MTSRTALLEYAEQILDGKVALGSSAPRTAALLARCALEEWLDEQSASWASNEYPFPNTRSKLVALAALGDAEIGAEAQRLWGALSRTVHHHAYELHPSVNEVRWPVDQGRRLEDSNSHGSSAKVPIQKRG
jgi:hypothetical protein